MKKCFQRCWDWMKNAFQWFIGILLVFFVIIGLLDLEHYCPLLRKDPNMLFTLIGTGGLFLLAFKEHFKNRSFSLGPEGIKLGEPVDISPGAMGNVRDDFIYLGNFYKSRKDYRSAFEFYLAASRLGSSMLTAFRCMQCLAQDKDKFNYDEKEYNRLLLEWFDKALWHADGPWKELKDRERFAEWVRNLRKERQSDSFATKLIADLKGVDY